MLHSIEKIYASQIESCNPKSWENDDQIFESTIV